MQSSLNQDSYIALLHYCPSKRQLTNMSRARAIYYPYMVLNCATEGVFGRLIDFKRHIGTQHEKIMVDRKYKWCSRYGDHGFARKDHYRDH